MSLDTVELIYNFENYFEIEIPDIEAEKISTVQQMADYIAKVKPIEVEDNSKHVSIVNLVINYLVKQGIEAERIQFNTPLRNIFTSTLLWDKFKLDFKKEKHLEIIKLNKPITSINNTFSDFIDWIFIANYKNLLDPKNIGSRYEIGIMVLGLTAESSSTYYHEIKLEHSFTNDLGLD